MAALRDRMPAAFNTPEVRFDCPEERKFGVVEAVKRDLLAEAADVNTTDGARVRTPEGWWLLRASNTQPALIIRAEASSEAGLGRLKEEVRTRLRAFGLEAPADF